MSHEKHRLMLVEALQLRQATWHLTATIMNSFTANLAALPTLMAATLKMMESVALCVKVPLNWTY